MSSGSGPDAPLSHDHDAASIERRLSEGPSQYYVGDAVLGGIDGCVTTCAMIAAVLGAGLSGTVAFVLGLANLIADGFSMAASNYESTRSDLEILEQTRAEEERQIDELPDGERQEIRQIYINKGFSGETLETIVEVITEDRKLWVDTMLREEYGLTLNLRSPMRSALVTFGAFVVVGSIPLFPFVLTFIGTNGQFLASLAAAAVAFFAVGWLKGSVLQIRPLRAGLQTLVIGSVAALLAFLIGSLAQRMADMIAG